MSNINTETLESCYRRLYEYQTEAAADSYTSYLKEKFDPDEIDWDDVISAKSALNSMISEIYEDCTDPEDVLDDCGVTQEIRDFLDD